MSVTITTAAWGDYWDRYGKKWTSHISNLNTKPLEVIVVSDRPIKTDFKVIIEKDCNLGIFRNAGIKSAEGIWIVPSDLDDEPLPNYIDNLDNNYDVIAYNMIDYKGKNYYSDSNSWENIFSINTKNPLVSCSAVKRNILLKIPYRKIGWEDWALWLDLKKAGVQIKFDNTIRYRYNNTPNSLSRQLKKIKDLEIINLKNQLK